VIAGILPMIGYLVFAITVRTIKPVPLDKAPSAP
jgi:hypothetical protein